MSNGTGKKGKAPGGGAKKAARPAKGRAGRALAFVLRAARWLVVALVMTPIVLVPLYTVVPPVSTLMIAETLAGRPVDRRWVGLDEIAPVLVASVMMSEDGRFCDHRGVDWTELNKVLADEDGPQRGASTITMQTVKNVFLWQARSVVRKAIEIPLALFADTVWGKRRTMEIYLNVAQWGPGVFGVEAAAQYHFGRSAAGLSATQAALLAVALPNPIARNPARPTPRLGDLAQSIVIRAAGSGPYTDCLAAPGSV